MGAGVTLYPGAVDATLDDNFAGGDSTVGSHAQHHADLAASVKAIQNELGTDPAAAFATLKARLDAMPSFLALAADAPAVVGTAYADAAPGLNIPLTSGVPVRFQYMALWVPNATTTGARFAINGPAFTRLGYSVRYANAAATNGAQAMNIHGGNAYNATGFVVGTASDAANNIAVVEGVIVPSANGSLALRSAAEVVSPGSVTVKAGSSVLFW